MAVDNVNKESVCEFMFSHIFHLVFSRLREKFRSLKMVSCIPIVALTDDCFGLQSTTPCCLYYFLVPSCNKEERFYPKRQCDEHTEI